MPFCPLYVDPHRICPRVFLANLSTLYPHRLDVRLVRPWTRKRLGAVGVFRQPVTLPQVRGAWGGTVRGGGMHKGFRGSGARSGGRVAAAAAAKAAAILLVSSCAYASVHATKL